MLINLSNHPSEKWDKTRKNAARPYGKLADLPLPAIDPEAETSVVVQLAEKYEAKIQQLMALENTSAFTVHIIGELVFCFMLVARLQKAGIPCFASTTRRESLENGDGTKVSKFEFVRLREY